MTDLELTKDFGELGIDDRRDADVGLVALNKSEVEAQLDAAHKYRRSVTRFLNEAKQLSTISVEVAQSCMYAIPRGGKTITGPSVRLAEICASAYGNLHLAARVVSTEGDSIVAQGGAWDLEKNIRFVAETRRKITGKNGARFNEDMINMTGNAAISIALRNAIFRVIPRAYVDRLYEEVRKVAVGDATTLVARRDDILGRLAKMGADKDRVLNAIGKAGVDDIGLVELEQLIGMGTAIHRGESQLDEVFPSPIKPLPAAAEGQRISLKKDPPKEKKMTVIIESPPLASEPEPAEPGSDG